MENKDLISRKALIDWFMTYVHSGIETIPAETVIEGIKGAPAVEAAQVVRCKDCGLWNEWDRAEHESLNNLRCSCAHFSGEDGYTVYTAPNDFCSYGERKVYEEDI